jgi:hypothetical protein
MTSICKGDYAASVRMILPCEIAVIVPIGLLIGYAARNEQ